ncbi:hypothetical protein AOLI_G00117830 [Acnodon oligacanthus]
MVSLIDVSVMLVKAIWRMLLPHTSPRRIPGVIFEAQCETQYCTDPNNSLQTELNSVPIYHYILVLHQDKQDRKCFSASYQKVAVGCTVTEQLATTETVDLRELHSTVNNQGQLLVQNNQLFESLPGAVANLTHQHLEQHNQLRHVASDIKSLSSQLGQWVPKPLSS